MKDIKNIQFSNDGETQKIEAEIAKLTIYKNQRGYFNNGGFTTVFTDKMIEIATDKNLKSLDRRLLELIIGYMGKEGMMYRANVQRLLGGHDYAKILHTRQPHIVKSFKKLEELMYIKRDKKRKELTILINPDLAYNGATKEYQNTRKKMKSDFDLELPLWKPTEAEIKKATIEAGEEYHEPEDTKQPWDSHAEPELDKVIAAREEELKTLKKIKRNKQP